MDRTCQKCNKVFAKPHILKTHLRRKTPCAPIINALEDLTKAEQIKHHICKYCGRRFATQISMYRHIRQACKIANSEDGMEKLMEHTLQRQLAGMRAENADMRAQIAELATLLKTQLVCGPAVANSGTIHNGPVNHITVAPIVNQVNQVQLVNQVQQRIAYIPWDGERRIDVSVAQMAAAFAENARLKEYVRFNDQERTNPDLAPPYVADILMDFVKRGHSDPTSRNVYVNPRRADQALVHLKSGQWEVLSLQEATRMILDGIAQTIHRVVLSDEERKGLPSEAQNALSLAELMYSDEPDEYVKRTKAPMAAHLANTMPTLAETKQLKQLKQQ